MEAPGVGPRRGVGTPARGLAAQELDRRGTCAGLSMRDCMASLLLLLLAAGPVVAEDFVLLNGRTLRGRVVQESPSGLVVQTDGGRIMIRRNELVSRAEPAPTIARAAAPAAPAEEEEAAPPDPTSRAGWSWAAHVTPEQARALRGARDRLLDELAALRGVEARRLALLEPADDETREALDAGAAGLSQRGAGSSIARRQAASALAAQGPTALPGLVALLGSPDGLEAEAAAIAITRLAPSDGVTAEDLRWLVWHLDVPGKLVGLLTCEGDEACHARWTANAALVALMGGAAPELHYNARAAASHEEACAATYWRDRVEQERKAWTHGESARTARTATLEAQLEEVRQGRRPGRCARRSAK